MMILPVNRINQNSNNMYLSKCNATLNSVSIPLVTQSNADTISFSANYSKLGKEEVYNRLVELGHTPAYNASKKSMIEDLKAIESALEEQNEKNKKSFWDTVDFLARL